jgi:hypothetical protein
LKSVCLRRAVVAVPVLSHTEEHRALVRTNLRALLEQGINPLSFFDRDYKKVSSSSSTAAAAAEAA